MKAPDYDSTQHLINKIYDLVNSGGSADYIVEEGTSGIWTYRKWASGVSECWGTQRHTVTGWGTWGSIYEGMPAIPQIDYPTGLFTSYPNVSMNSDGTYSTSGSIGVEIYKWGSNTKTPLGYVLRPNTVSGSTTYDVHITAKGFWKEFTPSVSRFDASTKIYTPTFASGIGVRSWGTCFVAKIGKIHMLSFWGLYSSSALTGDTKILTLESGKTFSATAGSFSSGNDGGILRISGNDVYANSINADTAYYGQAIFFEE